VVRRAPEEAVPEVAAREVGLVALLAEARDDLHGLGMPRQRVGVHAGPNLSFAPMRNAAVFTIFAEEAAAGVFAFLPVVTVKEGGRRFFEVSIAIGVAALL